MKPTLLLLTPLASAWGSLGHQTVAYVASSLVAPRTELLFQSLLHNTSSSYLANVATWADSFRYTSAGRFSAPFHFIDAEDSPPKSCGVRYVRDCGAGGCVVGAIGNYTSQLLDTELNGGLRNMAAKFIVHLIGDIHQPLHDESLARGGNGIPVLFNGVHVNLHHVWDTSIPEQLIGGYGIPFASAWAANLTLAITENEYKTMAPSWLKGMDLADPITTALHWAEETNMLVCTTVLPLGVEGVQDQELGEEYYEGAVEVVKLQVARAGFRLAKWLDLIAENQVGRAEL